MQSNCPDNANAQFPFAAFWILSNQCDNGRSARVVIRLHSSRVTRLHHNEKNRELDPLVARRVVGIDPSGKIVLRNFPQFEIFVKRSSLRRAEAFMVLVSIHRPMRLLPCCSILEGSRIHSSRVVGLRHRTWFLSGLMPIRDSLRLVHHNCQATGREAR